VLNAGCVNVSVKCWLCERELKL